MSVPGPPARTTRSGAAPAGLIPGLRLVRGLVTTGLYARLRHPIYVFGTLAFLLVLLSVQGWAALVVWAVLIPVQVVRARREESVLSDAFGEQYAVYRRSTWF
jgi:protein-S-isoprenylcysteine O-methyltransferase Ste14